MANERPTLYTGVTSDLLIRVDQHKREIIEGFTKKYHLHKLVYFEIIDGQMQSLIREKQIKDMNRHEKIIMIQKNNPDWRNLYADLLR